MPRAIGTIGLKLKSPIPRNPGGSIENIFSNYEQGKIASQEAQEQRPVAGLVSAKRYEKTVPVKHNASTARSSKQATRFQPATPFRGRTEMASLLQRAFGGY